LKHLAKSLVVLLIVASAWRYGRESMRAWLAHATRRPLAPVPSSVEPTSGEHYSPAEDLERLDYEAIRGARRSLDIAMYSFTDVLLASAVREAGRRGVRIRIYRDGNEYEREQAQARRHRSTTQTLLGEANIRIRVKPPGRDYMHLKQMLVDGWLLRTGSANWSASGEKREDDDADYSTDPNAIERFERDFESLWNRSDNIVVQ
jgi:phosphatidylserine/phosphatidylglycerophosphate/cardiolipin synthase-like enzyme